MPLHKNLSGAELHYPLGRSSEGTLLLEDDLASAYQIAQGSDNQFNISTVNGTEEITIGNGVQNPKILSPGTGDVGIGTLSPSSPNGNQVAVQVTGTSVGVVLDSTNGSGVPWEIQHNSGDMKVIYDGANTLGGGAKTAIALDAAGTMRLGAEVATPADPGSGNGGYVYVKSDGKLYFRSNALTETDLTASASGWDGTSGSSPALGGNLDGNGNNIVLDNEKGIIDENGQEQITFLTTSSAVNQLAVTNAAAGGNATAATSTAPIITGGGGTTNCDLALQGQGTGTVTVRSRGTNSGTLSLNNEGNTYAVNITVPLQDYLTADYTLTLPVDDGGSGQVMQSDGSGNLSWATPSSGGGYTVSAKSAGFTAAVDYYYVIDSSGGAVAAALPDAGATASGKTIGFKARHGASNAVTLNRAAGGNIDGAASNLILSTDMAAVELICDGTDWWIKS